MSGRLIDTNTAFTQVYHELADGRTVIQKKSNVIGEILEANKRQMNDASGRMGEWQMVGRVDPVVMEKWCREDGINYLLPQNTKALLRKLEERENRMFKTHPGRFA